MDNVISEHTLELLEYKKVCEQISRYCITTEGKTRCKEKKVSTCFVEIQDFKDLSIEFFDLLNRLQQPELLFFPEIEPFLNEQDLNSFNIEGIYSVGLFTKSILHLKSYLAQALEKNFQTKTLIALLESIPNLDELNQIIFSSIDNDGNIKLTPTLKKIQNEISSLETEVKKLLHRYFSNEVFSSMLQSTVPTTRDGRQVLAVKANYKGRISGIIHEYSQTGQTFYIEPSDVVEKNNDLFNAQAQYKNEINKILIQLTKTIFEQREILLTALELFSKLDVVSASCRWAKENSGTFLISYDKDAPEKQTPICLKKARHPLLKNPVPIDLVLSNETKSLIITGPNTGGKTVTLKTVTLFALLNQAGFPVLCEAESSLPYFDFIACDIGDEQSIDLSLSTFSSHMKNISYCLKNASENSLIALDELGNGTEPQEGSAIAMAVLDELLEKQAYVFVTSHYASLKHYGFTKSFCENASVTFDAESLSPTYKLLMGVPGESHAFDIAKKNGLSESIIEKAKQNLKENRTDISSLIKGLIEKNKLADETIKSLHEKEQTLSEKQKKLDLKELKVKQQELILKQKGLNISEKLFNEKRKEFENIIREIREGSLTKEKIISSKKWLSDFETELSTEEAKLLKEAEELYPTEKPSVLAKTEDLEEGQSIYVEDYNKAGTIIRKEKNNTYLVELGSMRITVPLEKIRLQAQEKNVPLVSMSAELIKTERAAFELRLLGLRESEAEKAMIKQLDLAVISGLKEFSVVHGKGDGILQKMVHKLLKKHPKVSDYYFANPEDGGTGKTYVKLK